MREESLEEVQSKIAHLERAMAELSDVVFTQYKQIQALEAQLTSVRDRLESALPAEARSLEQERPPHY
jgi:SlyX protein